MEKQASQVFLVPNTAQGKLFLELAKQYLNTNSYTLKARGRKPNKKRMEKDAKKPYCVRYSVPLKYADAMGVYLLAKVKDRDNRKYLRTCGIEQFKYEEYIRSHYYKSANKLAEAKTVLNDIMEKLEKWQTVIE